MKEENVSGSAPMAAPYTHEKVMELLKDEPRGKVLDAAAGEGYASEKLKELGFEAYPADLCPEKFKVKDMICEKADLNEGLPYPDSSFRYAVCIETIEHVENAYRLIREFGRVLEAGGKLVITTPNILNIYSRLRFFLVGKYEKFGDRFCDKERFEDLHVSPISFSELEYVIKEAGFEIERIEANRNVLKAVQSVPMRLILRLLAACIRGIAMFRKKEDTLFKRLLSKELLLGEILILKCRKVSAS